MYQALSDSVDSKSACACFTVIINSYSYFVFVNDLFRTGASVRTETADARTLLCSSYAEWS